jgi:hypothetical protein
MNKLRAMIQDAARVSRAGLGFGSSGARKGGSLLLLARGDGSKFGPVAKYADALLSTSAKARDEASPDVARGLDVADAGSDEWQESAANFNFLVVGEETPASALLSEEMAYLLRAPLDMPDSLLRSLEPVSLDGLVVAVNGSLNLRDQLALVRLAGFTHKPLFAELKRLPSPIDLEVLRDSGVIAVLLDAAAGESAFAEVRKSIEGLPPRRRRRDEREGPSVSLQATTVPAEEEEEFEEP